MTGRPVQLLAAASVAVASLFSISSASAGCYSGCGGYAAPVAYYTAPVVYSYSYAAPVRYAAPCGPCGGYGYAAPMYVVNQGPSYSAPVTIDVEPSYRHRAYPYYSGGGVRWHRRHWHRGYGHRSYGHGYRYGAVPPRFFRHGFKPRYRYGAIAPRFRYGAVVPGHRFGGMHRGPRHMMRHMRHMVPGVVHPRMHGPRMP